MSPGGDAAVAVVVATYNRSAALRCALASVVAQTFEDWELIVVGDACTDDSHEVAAGFGDPRIRFINLSVNIGEQSGPNNVGVARTTAPLVAFLNHDDLWFPDHLERSLAVIQARAADLVFSPTFMLVPADDTHVAVVVDGLARKGRFDPLQIDRATVASGWLVRRDALARLRGWRAAGECQIEPSQDLLFRAHKSRMRLWGTGMPTVICVPSGVRRGSYLGNQASDQEALLERLASGGLRAELFAAAGDSGPGRPAGRAAWFWAVRRLSSVGLSPRAVDFRIRRRLGRGDVIEGLRSVRGLDAAGGIPDDVASMRRIEITSVCTVPSNGRIRFQAGAGGDRHLLSGWSTPESWGTWNDGHSAVLALRLPAAEPGPRTLEIDVSAHVGVGHPAQRLIVDVAGAMTSFELVGAGPHHLSIALGVVESAPALVRLELPDAWSPSSHDTRRLAIGLLTAHVAPSSDDG